MKAVRLSDDLRYNAPFGDTDALLNATVSEPNIDSLSGYDAKYESFNLVDGYIMRMAFVEPTEWNVHYEDMGFCSDSSIYLEADCILSGRCSDGLSDETDCYSLGETWTPETWTPGLTALELFQRGEILVQGQATSGGCAGALLTHDYNSEMKFAQGRQFYGINGQNYLYDGIVTTGTGRIRFGYGSMQGHSCCAGDTSVWRPQIGMGLTYIYDFVGEPKTGNIIILQLGSIQLTRTPVVPTGMDWVLVILNATDAHQEQRRTCGSGSLLA